MSLQVENPVIVARVVGGVLIASRADAEAQNPMADVQLYEIEHDTFSDVKPAAVWNKFLYSIEEVNPPLPFDREALKTA